MRSCASRCSHTWVHTGRLNLWTSGCVWHGRDGTAAEVGHGGGTGSRCPCLRGPRGVREGVCPTCPISLTPPLDKIPLRTEKKRPQKRDPHCQRWDRWDTGSLESSQRANSAQLPVDSVSLRLSAMPLGVAELPLARSRCSSETLCHRVSRFRRRGCAFRRREIVFQVP